jgi:hypothetical protein
LNIQIHLFLTKPAGLTATLSARNKITALTKFAGMRLARKQPKQLIRLSTIPIARPGQTNSLKLFS